MKRRTLSNILAAYPVQIRLFLLPYLLGTFILLILPALATAALAFTDYSTIQTPTWAGLDNFRRLASAPLVRLSLRNSLIFLGLAVPLRLLTALLLALLLSSRQRFFGLYRAAVYLPTIVPEAAYALIWLWLLNPLYGPINIVLAWLGLPAPNWLVEPTTARLAIVLMLTFQMGEGFVILLAGLQNIPLSLYEAARVDGANRWHALWHITLPLLAPWLLLLTFRDILMSLQNTFTPSFILTYGGPYYATMFLPLLIYELAFDFLEYGLAAALLVLLYILMALIIIGIISLLRDEGGLGDV